MSRIASKFLFEISMESIDEGKESGTCEGEGDNSLVKLLGGNTKLSTARERWI